MSELIPVGIAASSRKSGCRPPRARLALPMYSDTPFASSAFADVVAQPGVSAYYRGAWSSSYPYAINRTGRYVRIRLPNGLEGWTEREGVVEI